MKRTTRVPPLLQWAGRSARCCTAPRWHSSARLIAPSSDFSSSSASSPEDVRRGGRRRRGFGTEASRPDVTYDDKEGTAVVQPRPPKTHRAAVIFMHGLGDTAAGWLDAAHYLYGRLAQEGHPMRFILPTARTRPITINGGMRMPGWYDIVGLDERAKEDFDGIEDSYARVKRCLQAELDQGISPSRIFLGGFSQGAAMALYSCYFKEQQTLGGVIALSGYLPFANRTAEKENKTPLLMCHGLDDGVVLFPWAKASFDQLKKNGVQGHFRTYPDMAHGASQEEMEDVLDFIRQRLVEQS